MTPDTDTIHSDIAIPPGEYLEEVIDDLGISKGELACRMNRPPSQLTPIFKGKKAITPATAIQIEKVTGVPAHIWTGLEAEYRLILAKAEENRRWQELKRESSLTGPYCYDELCKQGFVPRQAKPAEKVAALQSFFGVTSLHAVPKLKRYEPLFLGNQTENRSFSPFALSTWLRIGEKRASEIESAPFSKQRVKMLLPALRRMTTQSPDISFDDLHRSLAEAGIALVIAPTITKASASGATFWMRSDKAVMMMTIREQWSDFFWFRLFHQIGHILMHGTRQVFIESDQPILDHQKQCQDADRFASDTLIPPKEYNRFLKNGHLNGCEIKRFADGIDVDSGIIVSRLQNENRIDSSSYNGLRSRIPF